MKGQRNPFKMKHDPLTILQEHVVQDRAMPSAVNALLTRIMRGQFSGKRDTFTLDPHPTLDSSTFTKIYGRKTNPQLSSLGQVETASLMPPTKKNYGKLGKLPETVNIGDVAIDRGAAHQQRIEAVDPVAAYGPKRTPAVPTRAHGHAVATPESNEEGLVPSRNALDKQFISRVARTPGQEEFLSHVLPRLGSMSIKADNSLAFESEDGRILEGLIKHHGGNQGQKTLTVSSPWGDFSYHEYANKDKEPDVHFTSTPKFGLEHEGNVHAAQIKTGNVPFQSFKQLF